MSYCRIGDGDVYAYSNGREFVIRTRDNRLFREHTRAKLKARLLALRAQGLAVPDHALERIDMEIAKRRPRTQSEATP